MLLKLLIIVTIFVALVYAQLDDEETWRDMMHVFPHMKDRLQRTTTESIDTIEYPDNL